MTPAVSALAGVNVAMRPVAASSTTEEAVTGVEAGAGPVTVKLAVVTVDASMRKPDGTLKVALILASAHTPAAPAAGLVDSTDIFD